MRYRIEELIMYLLDLLLFDYLVVPIVMHVKEGSASLLVGKLHLDAETGADWVCRSHFFRKPRT